MRFLPLCGGAPSPKPDPNASSSNYKIKNWRQRNILKIRPPIEYYDGIEAAIEAAGLDETAGLQ